MFEVGVRYQMYHALLLCVIGMLPISATLRWAGIPLRTRNDSVFRIAVCTFAVWDSLAWCDYADRGLCFGGMDCGRRRCISSCIF